MDVTKMILSAFWSFYIILLISFCLYKKRLHLFEIIFIWLIVWLVTHSVSTIITINLGYLKISEQPKHFWLHLYNRIILYPLIIVWFIDIQSRFKYKAKIIIIFSIIILLTLVEHISIWKGVLINKNWNVWYSLIEWIFTFVFVYLSWFWYRRTLWRKDGL
jgi:hypothetical protein